MKHRDNLLRVDYFPEDNVLCRTRNETKSRVRTRPWHVNALWGSSNYYGVSVHGGRASVAVAVRHGAGITGPRPHPEGLTSSGVARRTLPPVGGATTQQRAKSKIRPRCGLLRNILQDRQTTNDIPNAFKWRCYLCRENTKALPRSQSSLNELGLLSSAFRIPTCRPAGYHSTQHSNLACAWKTWCC